MIGVVDIEIQAHSPQFPLARLVSFIGSPQSVRVRNVPRQIGSWRITRVYVKATYPDGAEAGAELKLVGGVWVGTFAGSAVAGSTSKGFAVYADGIDENGGEVSGYVLGVGDVDVLTDDGRTLPQEPLKVVNIVTEKPSSPHVGDAIWNSAGDLEIWDGSEWRTAGAWVSSVNGKTGAVSLTGADIPLGPTGSDTVKSAIDSKQGALPTKSEGEIYDIYVSEAEFAPTADWAYQAERAESNLDGEAIIDTYARKDESYTRGEIDDKITRFVAHYLTARVDGRFVPFADHAALAYAKTHHTDATPYFFYAGQAFTPTKNDYCVVLADETVDGKTTRYSYVGDWPTGAFQYQYTINDTAFSESQWAAINSGATAATVEKVADLDYRVGAAEREIDSIEATYATKNYVDQQIGEVLTEEF